MGFVPILEVFVQINIERFPVNSLQSTLSRKQFVVYSFKLTVYNKQMSITYLDPPLTSKGRASIRGFYASEASSRRSQHHATQSAVLRRRTLRRRPRVPHPQNPSISIFSVSYWR